MSSLYCAIPSRQGLGLGQAPHGVVQEFAAVLALSGALENDLATVGTANGRVRRSARRARLRFGRCFRGQRRVSNGRRGRWARPRGRGSAGVRCAPGGRCDGAAASGPAAARAPLACSGRLGEGGMNSASYRASASARCGSDEVLAVCGSTGVNSTSSSSYCSPRCGCSCGALGQGCLQWGQCPGISFGGGAGLRGAAAASGECGRRYDVATESASSSPESSWGTGEGLAAARGARTAEAAADRVSPTASSPEDNPAAPTRVIAPQSGHLAFLPAVSIGEPVRRIHTAHTGRLPWS